MYKHDKHIKKNTYIYTQPYYSQSKLNKKIVSDISNALSMTF